MDAVQPTLPPIAIIGMSCRFPGAADVEQYWRNLVDGRDTITRVADDPVRTDGTVAAVGHIEDVECFDADYFRIPPAEATLMDPQHRVMLEVAVAALEDAGYAASDDAEIGVFAGVGYNHYRSEFLGSGDAASDEVRLGLANEKDFLAPRIAFKLGLRGPSVTVQTGCSTSLAAVALACQALATGDCEIALAGGVSLMMPDVDGYKHVDGGIYSRDGRCRVFDRCASGTVPASGAGMVVLKPEAAARADRDHRRAVIRGWAVNNDGGTGAGFTAPSVKGQAEAVGKALARAGVRPRDVAYVEAHGTGTALGDPVEVEALRTVFGADDGGAGSCAIGSVKSNIGHTDTAAGVAGLIKAALALERGTIPATLYFEEANPEIGFEATPFYVCTSATPWASNGRPRIAGVSSFGLGGTNVHVVVQEPEARTAAPPDRPQQLLALSARSDEEVGRVRARLADWLEARGNLDDGELADVAFTLAVGRPQLSSRWLGVVSNSRDAVAALREQPARSTPSGSRWTLVVQGTPDEFAVMPSLTEDPLVAEVFAELTAASRGEPSPGRRGTLAVLAAARALQELGLSFARITAPGWFAPAAQWLESGHPADGLPGVLDACVEKPAMSQRGSYASAGAVVVRPSFDLGETVAWLWPSGTRIDWDRYYSGAPRGRVSLPSYPFARRRFWRARTEVAQDVAPEPQIPVEHTSAVEAYVDRVWRGVLGLSEIDPDANFSDDLDGDSMLALEIVAQLHDRFGVELPADLLLKAPTVKQTASHIERELASPSVAG